MRQPDSAASAGTSAHRPSAGADGTSHSTSDTQRRRLNAVDRAAKRTIDIGGALLFFAVFGPLYLLVALAVLLSMGSPVYYWQNRLAEFRNIPDGTEFTLKNLDPNRVILGNPETCVREFNRWQEVTGAGYCLLRLRHAHSGGPPHAKILEAIKRFGDQVLPHCR